MKGWVLRKDLSCTYYMGVFCIPHSYDCNNTSKTFTVEWLLFTVLISVHQKDHRRSIFWSSCSLTVPKSIDVLCDITISTRRFTSVFHNCYPFRTSDISERERSKIFHLPIPRTCVFMGIPRSMRNGYQSLARQAEKRQTYSEVDLFGNASSDRISPPLVLWTIHSEGIASFSSH